MDQTKRNEIKGNALSKTLAEVNAVHLFDSPAPNSKLSMYSVNGNVLIVQYFSNGDGYEVYGPIDKTNSVTATHRAIRALLNN